MHDETTLRPDQARLLRDLSPTYLWWAPIGDGGHDASRAIAQIMNLGTYDDILALERAFRPDELAAVMLGAAPGWFSPRSWSFWAGRLSRDVERSFPPEPPRRGFDDAPLP